MSYDFKPFAKIIHDTLERLSTEELFVVDATGDELWVAYLGAFPEGTNPIYRTRPEYDCACCRNFIKNFGGVVALKDGKPVSIWATEKLEYPFDEVAAYLDEFVKATPIRDIFRTKEHVYGVKQTVELLEDKTTKTWEHFCCQVHTRHYSTTPDKARGDYRTTVELFERGLKELDRDAIDTVIDLINSGSLYRGEEHMSALQGFRSLQRQYDALSNAYAQNNFLWANARSQYARFRNTVIGTLVQDLSEGKEIEHAVKAFEIKVAPTNYKRPNALITQRMVQDAMKTIEELGLQPALERRYAKMSDITVNNVLWADASARERMMKNPLENLLMEAVVKPTVRGSIAEIVNIEDFMEYVLPTATSIDMMVKGSHLPNFVSLTAPIWIGARDSQRLFKWKNDFAWSYDGNITDSIKERVKKAGGNVTNAAMRVSLAWFNLDDLDIHVMQPDGSRIWYRDKRGMLDVDMNAFGPMSRQPVENVSWLSSQLMDGVYRIIVNQFNQRETSDYGFQIEIENAGQLSTLSYGQTVKTDVEVCLITVKQGRIEKIQPAKGIIGGGFSQDKWGIKTETTVRVEALMHSPNYWDDNAVGNKHYIFALEGCQNPDSTRGIYNEFLRGDLEKHRKVFEILGDKTKCPPSAEQISGLGFSSTRGDTVSVKVIDRDSKIKTYNINF